MNINNFLHKKSILLGIFVFAFNSIVLSQICGNKFSSAEMQRHYNTQTLNGAYIPQDTCLNKKFSLVIHIVLDSSGTTGVQPGDITKGIDSLNKYFKPICVSFEACFVKKIKDYNYNEWDKTIHEPVVRLTYHDAKVINIYLVENIVKPAGAAGYAASGNDLIVIKKNAFASMVSVHEMGHFFDLPHTFENFVPELVIRSNACYNSGDGFCDTDADPYPAGKVTSMPCEFQVGPQDAQGQYYTPPVDNIMSYWKCPCKFTQEQYNWMALYIRDVKNYLH